MRSGFSLSPRLHTPPCFTYPDVPADNAELFVSDRAGSAFHTVSDVLFMIRKLRVGVQGAAVRVRFEESSQSHWWVAEVDTFTFTLCLSVCPLCWAAQCLTLPSSLSLWMKQAWLWQSAHHRLHFPQHCAVAHNAGKLINCRFDRAVINQLRVHRLQIMWLFHSCHTWQDVELPFFMLLFNPHSLDHLKVM